MSMRIDKINHELRKLIMQFVQKEVDDQSLDFMSITRVTTSPDFHESKVYFSVLDEDSVLKVQKVLERMSGFIRTFLSKNIRLKVLPKLTFLPDDTIRYSVEIYQKIEEVKEIDQKRGDWENEKCHGQEDL